MPNVPLLDLHREYAPIRQEVIDAITRVVDSTQFIMGPDIAKMEAEMAAYCGTKFAYGLSSGTDALLLALMALGIGHGDEVITSPFTFFATAGCIARVGAKAVFVDIDADTFNIDTSQIEAAITSKTKAIMPVHLFGQMADMEAIMDIAERYSLHVIEDAAQAIGAKAPYRGEMRSAGSIGTVGCFSFFPSKNLGCCGDGGLVTTQNPEVASQLEIMRVHGGKQRYYHDVVGGNFRMDSIQAAVLRVKLPHLDRHHQARKENAKVYNQALKNLLKIPVVKPGYDMIYNQYTLQVPSREAVIQKLNDAGIGYGIYYPLPLHLQTCFESWGYQKGDFPNAEKAAESVVSIPIFSGLTPEELDQVVKVLQTV
jgi:dTDP-4-amino-4,6-dideoxygalactose transaminase